MRVILDTNVWSRLVDRDQVDSFASLEKSRGLEVVVPPSTLLEALATPKPEIRERLVVAMAARGRIHPLTEACLEARELVAEARRLRPEWLRRRQQTDRMPTLEAFWTRRIWDQARRDPAGLARVHAAHGRIYGDRLLIDALVENQREQRQTFVDVGFTLSGRWAATQTLGLENSDAGTRSGWKGDPVEAWRVFTGAIFWGACFGWPRPAREARPDKTYADWALPWLNPARVSADRADWNRFFYYEIQAGAMPRCWLRSTIHSAQYGRKVGHGNPVDEQHCAYLLDADLFLTGDTRLQDLLIQIIPFCPVGVAATRLVPADSKDVVAAIEEALAWIKRFRPSGEGS